MLEYYLRLNDPLAPVYAIDPDAGTYQMAGSRIGIVEGVGGLMLDGGKRFRSKMYARVWPNGEEDGVIRFTRDAPADAA